jgi:hypothetical protein
MMPSLREEVRVSVKFFIYLQILDFLTTLVGLKLGVPEASPFVRSLMHYGPGFAVAASKIMAIGLAGLCVALNRTHLVRWINYWYAALIIWNLCSILIA